MTCIRPYLSAGLVLAALLAAGIACAEHPDTRPLRQWNFDVYLDDREIGFHRFRLSDSGDGLRLETRAEFQVKVLLVTAYTYDHVNTEIWRGDCLRGIEARTDANGELSHVSGVEQDGRLVVSSSAGATQLDGCVASFAYWDRRLLERKQLLNSQTGEYMPVKFQPLGAASMVIGGRRIAVQRYALTADRLDIELAYSANTGEWLALDSRLESGRTLRYRRSVDDLADVAGLALTGNLSRREER
jgi:hypothetical protein